jgi:hypothetical protein
VKLATEAVESKAPDFMSYDSQGKSVPGPSLDFVAWAKAHNLSVEPMTEKQVFLFPHKVWHHLIT